MTRRLRHGRVLLVAIWASTVAVPTAAAPASTVVWKTGIYTGTARTHGLRKPVRLRVTRTTVTLLSAGAHLACDNAAFPARDIVIGPYRPVHIVSRVFLSRGRHIRMGDFEFHPHYNGTTLAGESFDSMDSFVAFNTRLRGDRLTADLFVNRGYTRQVTNPDGSTDSEDSGCYDTLEFTARRH